jgi:putative intracellular protease/amidase
VPQTVHLYLFDGYADWEPAFAVAGIHNPQFQREPGRWQVRTVGERAGQAMRSMGGVAVLADIGLAELEPVDSRLLILPGGPRWDEEDAHVEAIGKASTFLERGVPVAAICGATAGLARAGRLDARAHTSNAAAYLKGTGYAGAEHYRDEPAVREGGLITAGGMAPLEFAREIFLELGIFDDEALEAWYRLYKTGKSEHFARMARAAHASEAD